MSDDLPPPGESRENIADNISHQASLWFALVQAGSPTQADRDELDLWLRADPRHAQAYAHLEFLWNASAMLPPVSVVPGVSRRRFVGLAMAACSAAVATGATTLWLKGAGSPFADLRTVVGEKRVEQLPDGSTVELAGNTALNVDFSTTQRRIELLQGEAFFKISVDSARPFRVDLQAGRILAGESEFSLSCEGHYTDVAVSRRTVQVQCTNQQIELGQGQSLHFSDRSVGVIQHAELEQVLAWRSGRLVFFDTTLETVIHHVQRWREGKIIIADSHLASRRISLILNLNRPEQMLDTLAKALPVRLSRYTDLLTVVHPA